MTSNESSLDGLQVLVVLSTFPDEARAVTAARTLVDEGLAACVNVLPGLRSIYRFEGQLHDDAEVLCLIKTTTGSESQLRARLASLHPYQVPEIIALPVVAGDARYLGWVASSVQPRRS